MADEQAELRPAERDGVVSCLAGILQGIGRPRAHDVEDIFARLIAERVIRELEEARYRIVPAGPAAGSQDAD